MKILILHGWQSVPGGVKPTYLAEHGHIVFNLPDDDFDQAVRIAQAEFDEHVPEVVVGSSRGGAVAMKFVSGQARLVLARANGRSLVSGWICCFCSVISHASTDPCQLAWQRKQFGRLDASTASS
jgi:hypothetical protein